MTSPNGLPRGEDYYDESKATLGDQLRVLGGVMMAGLAPTDEATAERLDRTFSAQAAREIAREVEG